MIIYLNASGVFHINGPVLDIFHFFFNTGIHMMSYRYMQCSERSKEKHFVNGISLFRLILVINVIIDDSASKKKLKNSIIMTDTHTWNYFYDVTWCITRCQSNFYPIFSRRWRNMPKKFHCAFTTLLYEVIFVTKTNIYLRGIKVKQCFVCIWESVFVQWFIFRGWYSD